MQCAILKFALYKGIQKNSKWRKAIENTITPAGLPTDILATGRFAVEWRVGDLHRERSSHEYMAVQNVQGKRRNPWRTVHEKRASREDWIVGFALITDIQCCKRSAIVFVRPRDAVEEVHHIPLGRVEGDIRDEQSALTVRVDIPWVAPDIRQMRRLRALHQRARRFAGLDLRGVVCTSLATNMHGSRLEVTEICCRHSNAARQVDGCT